MRKALKSLFSCISPVVVEDSTVLSEDSPAVAENVDYFQAEMDHVPFEFCSAVVAELRSHRCPCDYPLDCLHHYPSNLAELGGLWKRAVDVVAELRQEYNFTLRPLPCSANWEYSMTTPNLVGYSEIEDLMKKNPSHVGFWRVNITMPKQADSHRKFYEITPEYLKNEVIPFVGGKLVYRKFNEFISTLDHRLEWEFVFEAFAKSIQNLEAVEKLTLHYCGSPSEDLLEKLVHNPCSHEFTLRGAWTPAIYPYMVSFMMTSKHPLIWADLPMTPELMEVLVNAYFSIDDQPLTWMKLHFKTIPAYSSVAQYRHIRPDLRVKEHKVADQIKWKMIVPNRAAWENRGYECDSRALSFAIYEDKTHIGLW